MMSTTTLPERSPAARMTSARAPKGTASTTRSAAPAASASSAGLDGIAELAGDGLRLGDIARALGDRVAGVGEEPGETVGHFAGVEDRNIHVGSP
jgi:hypothetical protein